MEISNDALRRYSLAVLVHVLLVVAWYLFVKLGDVPKFVMPTPGEALMALFTGTYGWWQNFAVTAAEIFGGYFLALFIGVGLALLFTWSRWLEELAMPALVSLNMIPKVALGPLFIVWFKYGVWPNMLIAFSIALSAHMRTDMTALPSLSFSPVSKSSIM